MAKKVIKALISAILIIAVFLGIVAVGVQLIYFREKENTSVSRLDFIDNDDPVFLTAHRGVNYYAPENTIPAYEKAEEMNYYAAECDIMLTKDNIWVLTHDDTTFLHFWGFKKVSETDYEDLCKLTYKNGTNFSKFKNLKIPTLDEYLDTLKNSNTRPQIEIKSDGTDGLDTILSTLENKQMKEEAIIISFDINQLIEIRKMDRNIELWYLSEEINKDVINDYKKLNSHSKLAIKAEEVTDDAISEAIDSAINLAAWTINDTDELERIYKLGIRYVTTDSFCN